MKYEIDEELTLKVEKLEHNLVKISWINKIYMTIFLSLIIIINMLEIVPSIQFYDSSSIELLHYSILLIVNCVYVYLLDIRKISVSVNNYKSIKFLIHFYIAFFLNMAILLPILDDTLYNSLLIYSLILFSSIPFLVIKPLEMLISLCISSFLLLMELSIHHGKEDVYYLQVTYILTLVVIVFFISRSSYLAYLRNQKLRTDMTQEVQHLRNLTELLKETNRQLELEATLDPLTNLYNRRAYNDYIINLQQKISETHHTISVIMVDVDCFKLYNDTYGHTEGDNVLVKIGRLLNNISIEFECFAGRFGGEEFILILSNESKEIVENICFRVKEGVSELNIQHQSSSIDTVVTVSIGACTKEIRELKEIYDCISEADAALYTVKENGRNSFEYRHQLQVL
ncbi:GGDEF domain-containing protein [Ureibacillus sp. GCM10028918]|uniref:GGDEF domain-containing protein n=1 Tax=Ureibacillus sp. GCM10028918 TaxID=3273429 RepID=UPI003612ECFB